ncbi:hypothetical protein L4C36_19600 [Photobacterium japonica]|uniref:hypothetical protein n=1 Tax=Photobacterium japonica TaxID=2910235 RepID=UPI003D0FFD2E
MVFVQILLFVALSGVAFHFIEKVEYAKRKRQLTQLFGVCVVSVLSACFYFQTIVPEQHVMKDFFLPVFGFSSGFFLLGVLTDMLTESLIRKTKFRAVLSVYLPIYCVMYLFFAFFAMVMLSGFYGS